MFCFEWCVFVVFVFSAFGYIFHLTILFILLILKRSVWGFFSLFSLLCAFVFLLALFFFVIINCDINIIFFKSWDIVHK